MVGRIGIVGPSHPFRGGIATFSDYLARGLLEAGHEVMLFTYTVQYPRWLFRRNPYTDALPPPVPIRRLFHAFNPLTWPAAARSLAAYEPDALIYPFWLPIMGLSAGYLARQVRKRYPPALQVGLIHNFFPHERRLGDRFFRAYFVEGMQAAFTLSHETTRQWQAFTKKPVRFFHHPLYQLEMVGLPSREEAYERLGLEPAYRYLLFIGIIRPYKGLDLLLKAWAQAQSALGSAWRLLIAGEFYEAEAPYWSLIRALGVEETVIIRPGFVPQALFPYYFRAAEAIVLPYRHGTQSGHPFWAYQYERPMLVTRVGGLYEVVEAFGGGLIVEPTVEAIAAGLIELARCAPEAFAADFAQAKAALSWQKLGSDLWAWLADLRKTLNFEA